MGEFVGWIEVIPASPIGRRPSAAEPLLADSCQVGGDDTANHVYSPVGMVEESVVAAAERDAVFDAGGTIVGPVDDVMDFAPAGGY